MLQHVWERACRAGRLRAVWIATDDDRIARAARGFGARVVMTSAAHPSGSDRVAEAAAHEEAAADEIIVNVQGDQPLIEPGALDALVAAFDPTPCPDMATLFEPLSRVEDLVDPNVAKVVSDASGHALYFSRSPIPYARGKGASMKDAVAQARGLASRGAEALSGCFKHVGVYAFTKSFLMEFVTLPRGPLELAEGLEQLRVLEAGRRIRLVRSSGSSASVETPADLARVELLMSDPVHGGSAKLIRS